MLDELERLEKAATPAPWGEFAESGEWWVERQGEDGGAAGDFVCGTNTEHYSTNGPWAEQADIDLMIAARNALPGLLRVARAAREFEAAQIDVDRAGRDPMGGSVINGAYHREHAARAELWAALAALEAPGND